LDSSFTFSSVLRCQKSWIEERVQKSGMIFPALVNYDWQRIDLWRQVPESRTQWIHREPDSWRNSNAEVKNHGRALCLNFVIARSALSFARFRVLCLNLEYSLESMCGAGVDVQSVVSKEQKENWIDRFINWMWSLACGWKIQIYI